MKTTSIRRATGRTAEESGFTLVELLVVMLILGLLAAIAVPAFFNQRDKAKDSDAKAGARTAQTAMEIYKVEHDGEYTGADVADLEDIEGALTDYDGGAGEPTLTVNSAGADDYELQVAENDTGSVFTITRSDTGEVEYSCTDPGDDGCPGSGFWG
jgi:type IV pilus assembly protein PilA